MYLLPDVGLRCFVVRQLLFRIYALSNVKFPDLKLRLCKISGMQRTEELRILVVDNDYWIDVIAICGTFSSLFTLIQEVYFQSLVSCGLAGLPRYQFSAELNERRHLDERESFVF